MQSAPLRRSHAGVVMTRAERCSTPTAAWPTAVTAGTPVNAFDTEPTRHTARASSVGRTRPISEGEFLRQVTDLAELLGYEWVHFRPAQTSKGWRTPVSGTLGKGFPDLILVHRTKNRLLFRELKRDEGRLTPDQERVIATLTEAGCDVAVWMPRDFDAIAEELR